MVSKVSPFNLIYDVKSKSLNLYKNNAKISTLNAKDLKVPGFDKYYLQTPFNPDKSPINKSTAQTIRCLKIKEQRLHYAKHHPIANGILSVISCIGMGILALPWFVASIFALCSESYDSFDKSTKKTFNRIRPVFIKEDLQKSIEKDKQKLIKSITKMDKLYTQEYINLLQQQHQQNIIDYGQKAWRHNYKAEEHYEYMMQIIDIAKNVFKRSLVNQI
jgi:hypothetical protein